MNVQAKKGANMKGVHVDRYERLLLAKHDELLAGTVRTVLTAGRVEGTLPTGRLRKPKRLSKSI